MFEVELSARAERDFDSIVRYLLKRSPTGAARWIDAFEAMLSALPNSAEANALAPENADHLDTIRNAFFKTRSGRTYRALYIIRGGRLFITHIRGPGQDRVGDLRETDQ
ncbi:Plasmid stabilization system protein [Botrimarina colliarenosi]|uniref:Plasmid stabilization system protein n=1 Tax=Botrimarina colliarenosi TaxID=2528001 RepID=A0A5C6A188_9BACT|nr:type II toxin-antitoxin system RelE/ParE family toxin [Botrimarina colliarenosi]TWT92313.1 Plasmid stabilization system protein [Botrimarina colliarenosi]